MKAMPARIVNSGRAKLLVVKLAAAALDQVTLCLAAPAPLLGPLGSPIERARIWQNGGEWRLAAALHLCFYAASLGDAQLRWHRIGMERFSRSLFRPICRFLSL